MVFSRLYQRNSSLRRARSAANHDEHMALRDKRTFTTSRRHQDCTHFCLPSSTMRYWNDVLYTALVALVGGDEVAPG